MNTCKSILVIDDDEVFRNRLARAFRDRGLNVVEASDGDAACECAERVNPNLIVLDLKLKSESGLVVLKKLLQINRVVKVVVLTGYGTIATAVEAVKIGAVNYISKPVDADTVLAAFHDDSLIQSSPITVPHLAQVEWDHIQRVVHDHKGNVTKAAKALGMHRRSLQRKLGKNPPPFK